MKSGSSTWRRLCCSRQCALQKVLALHQLWSALDDLCASELAEWPGGVVRAWENLFWFCVGVFPVLAAALGCVWLCGAVQWSRVDNVGRKKHIIRVVTLYHKLSLKSLFQPAKEEGEDPMLFMARHSWVFILVSVFLSLLWQIDVLPHKCLWLWRQNAKPNCYIQPVRIFPVWGKECNFLQIMTFCGNISVQCYFIQTKADELAVSCWNWSI